MPARGAGQAPVALVTGGNRGIGLEVLSPTERRAGAPCVRVGWPPTWVDPAGRPVAKGAASIVWAVVLPDDGPSGGFFRDGRRLDW